MAACRGTTKAGLPCRIAWDLDALGFCKFHTQLAAKCRGVARSTGQRCRIKWDLNARGFCRFHAAQAVDDAPLRRCLAVAKSTGQRCRISTGLDAHGLCGVHQRVLARSHRRCRGRLLHSGEPCTNDAKPGYAYCCAAHDPAIAYFSPRLFDAPDKSRALLDPDVVRLYNGRDLYHGELLDLVTPGGVELDHILEKQCFSFAFHGLVLRDRPDDASFLASVVRDEVANELSNLCLTRTTTNKIKGAAVWKFLDDATTGHADERRSFTDYLLAETRDGKRLPRATTGTIVREMGRALKTSQRKLADQGETPLLDALSQQLQHVYVRMDLHYSHASTSRLDASAKPFTIGGAHEPKSREPGVLNKGDSRGTQTDTKDSEHATTGSLSPAREETPTVVEKVGKQIADAMGSVQAATATTTRSADRRGGRLTGVVRSTSKSTEAVGARSVSSLADAVHAKPFVPGQSVDLATQDGAIKQAVEQNDATSEVNAEEATAEDSCAVVAKSERRREADDAQQTTESEATPESSPAEDAGATVVRRIKQ